MSLNYVIGLEGLNYRLNWPKREIGITPCLLDKNSAQRYPAWPLIFFLVERNNVVSVKQKLVLFLQMNFLDPDLQ